MALTKVRGGAIDNPLTLGGGSASDNSIIFDGNAQDFHIGLDDSTDSLTIGLGSTLGTTSHMVIDATGAITKPLQPAFSVRKSSDQNDINQNSSVTITFDTEVFDNNADFASDQFTAPVTGKYNLHLLFRLDQIDTGANYYQTTITTSNRNYTMTLDPNYSADVDYTSFAFSVLADMDANDTAACIIYQAGGSQQTDLNSGNDTMFMGHLVC